MDLETRIDISRLSAGEAVNRLRGLTDEMADADSFPSMEWAACKLLADRMAQEDAADTGRALASEWLPLDFDPEASGPNDYKLLTAAALAGRLKMEDATEKLLEFLKADWEAMNEEVERAFSRMNNQAALQKIRSAWPELRDYERLYLSSSFARVHPTGFDDFYKQVLLESDDEPYTGLSIARALIHTGQRSSLDLAREYLDGFHPYDPEGLEGFETLYAHYILRDYRLDDAAEIESRLSDRQRRLEERSKSFIPQQPIRKPAKVGRNDPCPCGSGRKYKKCCL